VAIAYLINLATLPVTGHAVEFRLHPSLLVGSLVAGVIVVVLAAWVPANRAARLDLPETLRMA
jgi:putative ABC transport system permease protein